MCEQCVTDAMFYGVREDGEFAEVLPGWLLFRAQKDGISMKAGDWGLVRCNDPDFVWTVEPFPDPGDGLTDDQINLSPPAVVAEMDRFQAAVEQFAGALIVEATLGHAITEAAKQAGYDQQKHGGLSHWLFHRLGRWIQVNRPVHHGGAQ